MEASSIRTFAGAFTAGILMSSVNAPVGAASHSVRYACPASEHLTVERDSAVAHVRLARHSYDLHRKHSSIGDKYLSRNAALIIDGASAVFVAPGRLNLGTCTRTVPLASAR